MVRRVMGLRDNGRWFARCADHSCKHRVWLDFEDVRESIKVQRSRSAEGAVSSEVRLGRWGRHRMACHTELAATSRSDEEEECSGSSTPVTSGAETNSEGQKEESGSKDKRPEARQWQKRWLRGSSISAQNNDFEQNAFYEVDPDDVAEVLDCFPWITSEEAQVLLTERGSVESVVCLLLDCAEDDGQFSNSPRDQVPILSQSFGRTTKESNVSKHEVRWADLGKARSDLGKACNSGRGALQ